MTPITLIAEQYVQQPKVPDIEAVAARLHNHRLRITITNAFLSDVGDAWRVRLEDLAAPEDDETQTSPSLECFAPTLRRALLEALYKAADRRGESQWQKRRAV